MGGDVFLIIEEWKIKFMIWKDVYCKIIVKYSWYVVFFWMIINIFLYFKGVKYIVIWYENIIVMLMFDIREIIFFR